jgi:hypothetical protein
MHERDLKEASGLFILINKQASLFLALFISGKKKNTIQIYEVQLFIKSFKIDQITH